MSVDNKVPEIRFEVFSEEWEKYPLAKFISSLDAGVSVNSGDRPADENEFGILKTSCVTNGFFEPNENKVVFKTEEISRLKEPVLENTIIISRMNTPALVGANAYVGRGYANYFLPDRLWAAKPTYVGDLKFIAYILGSDKGRLALSDLATGTSGSMKNISKPAVLRLELCAPKETEQTTIGNYFQKLDSLINQHQQKHDKLSNIKKAMLEKMFPKLGETTPKIRFKGFSGKWIENNLGELIDIRSAARVHKEQWTEAGVPFFRTSDVVSIYKGQENTKAYISHDVYHGLSEKIGKVTKDDLLITGGGSIGIPYLVPNDNPLYFKDADLLWLKNNKKINGYFLYTFFFSAFFKQHIKSISHIGTIAHYTIEQAKVTPINTCSQEEQTAIGNYFQKLDALINQHQQQIIKLNNIKQACLSKMFV
jgi:restriction endonuclease S subunit